MPVVFTDEGMQRALHLVATAWPNPRRVGLYSNVVTVDRHLVRAALVPTVFSGYAGELAVPPAWSVSFPSPFALANDTPLLWTCDGVSAGDYVAGYYVVDDDDTLLWAEARDGVPQLLHLAGQTYEVVLSLAAYTKYGGET